jgi:hypothetical protein
VPIVAARNLKTEEGDMLMLWLRLKDDGVGIEIGYEDDFEDGIDVEDLDEILNDGEDFGEGFDEDFDEDDLGEDDFDEIA